MSQISIIGSGRSATFLIEYLFNYCSSNQLNLKVYDRDLQFAQQALPNLDKSIFEVMDVSDKELLEQVVLKSNIVVSMLPASMHPVIAELCIQHSVHFATASYVSDMMIQNSELIKNKGLIFLNEMGLDPGIDHMSAMKILDEIRSKGGKITGFKSFTGGLVADEDDGDNPWKYKFSWNPRNVVLAAQDAPALYLENGKIKISSYLNIFSNAETIHVDGYGVMDAYPNRDSLKYLDIYQLKNLNTMLRGTFRKSGFCKSWHVFVALGMTDDNLVLELDKECNISDWLRMYLPGDSELKSDFEKYVNNDSTIFKNFEWLGFFADEKLPLSKGTSAQILEELLKSKWFLHPEDKDLVVMQHIFEFEYNGKVSTLRSNLVLKGETNIRTAMAKTVGLPLAIGCKLIIENKIQSKGVITPVSKEIYEPVLKELRECGIVFNDTLN